MLATRETAKGTYSRSMANSAPRDRTHQGFLRNKPVRWWHEAIVDDMLMFPKCQVQERAKRLGYSSQYLGMVMNSDLFKALYEKRRAEFNAALDQGIQTKARMAADKTLDVIIETLETKRNSIPFPALAEYADKTLERLGYGSSKGNGVNVNVVTPLVTAEQLADARATLRAVEDKRTIEHEPVKLPPKE